MEEIIFLDFKETCDKTRSEELYQALYEFETPYQSVRFI